MIELKIHYNGSELDWELIQKDAVDSVLRELAVAIREGLDSLRPHEHGSAARVVIRMEGNEFHYEITKECCPRLRSEIVDSIGWSLENFFGSE